MVSTILMQIRMEVYSGSGNTTEVNLVTSDRRRFHQWKASDMSHWDIQTGPPPVLASNLFCKRQARQVPNFIALRGAPLSMEALTDGVA